MTHADLRKFVKISAAAKKQLKWKGIKGKQRCVKHSSGASLPKDESKLNNLNGYCGSKVVYERVKSKLQDLTILKSKSFFEWRKQAKATRLIWTREESLNFLPLCLSVGPRSAISRKIVCPQLELLKHKY